MRLATPAVLFAAAAILAACGQGGDKASEPSSTAATEAAPAPPPTDAEKQAIAAALPAPFNTADRENGRKKFALCRSCHTLEAGGHNMTGPNLHGLIGRKAASADFNYSDALKQAGFTWDAAHLDPWIEHPKVVVPGTKMAFAGVKDAKDRTDLIAYLMVETK